MKRITVSCLAAPRVHGLGNPRTVLADVISELRSAVESVLPHAPDLILLQEACDQPRAANPSWLADYYCERADSISALFSQLARDNGAHIAWTAVDTDDNMQHMRTSVTSDSGRLVAHYDKLFPAPVELDSGISPGSDVKVFELAIARVGCIVCFDLNFTELIEPYRQQHPDAMLFSSLYDGGLMQRYWAYQTRAWLVAAVEPPNRCRITSPVGRVVAESTCYRTSATACIELDYAVCHLDGNETALRLAQQDLGDELVVDDPDRLGAVLVTCNDPARSVPDLCRHYGIELLDDYFDRARAARDKRLRTAPRSGTRKDDGQS